ncbi:zinc-binding metallopeptidase [Sphingobacterium psychroaquaticum]|uniref:Substrate import-associated zinc metallohydrolase lipoprotein n=1 Tax=Sphingobacterium psychroaquaticum TaxID=561061 RepID=A0A1X7JA26_9SPHI|nr:putative zinc-binding metallopeptidase [Sphingobacterium psychroaquaticum]QBQ39967.1 hypothetical protein E2P86_01890 [Sphingobacterium psychroaquaticum]SMG24542.1 substrate import-associated zinc metallohydrolase lipoprotein [Sphingobacterium psychroaquaticum]
MKKNIHKFTIAIILLFTWACSADKISPDSVFTDLKIDKNELDLFIEEHFIKPYNVGVIYKYVDGESDMNYNLSPATYESAVRMTVLFKYLGIEPYDEVTGSTDFIRSYFPKSLSYIGSPAYRNNGTMVLGTAEGGRKITMYNLNALTAGASTNINYLNRMYFRTIHHEFAHILNQTKDFSRSFDEISAAGYVSDAWNTEYGESTGLIAGFISPYASKEAKEDFVEVYSFYILLSPEQWEERVARGGEVGRPILERKLEIVRAYFHSVWNIDLDELRDEILKRQANLPNIDQLSLN